MTNRSNGRCISFSMEKRTEYLFYIGIQKADGQGRLSKTALPFSGGKLIVYSYLAPEALVQPSKKLLQWRRKRQERLQSKRLLAMLEEAVERVHKEILEERITYFYLAEEVENRLPGKNSLWQENDMDALMDRLYEVCLYHGRKVYNKATLTLSLPKECGDLAVMRIITIIEPYLSRVNDTVFVGAEDAGAQMLEEYLYNEYGIVMNYDRFPARNTIWIDLRDRQDQILSKYAKENGICHINRAEVLKFLDTVAKNGYNTKVN